MTAASRKTAIAASWMVVCVAGAAAVVYATSLGVGIAPDSTSYVGKARSWLEPLGVVQLTGPPAYSATNGPLYPFELAVGSLILRQDPATAARWINVIALPINLLLMAIVFRRAAPGATWGPLYVAVALLISPAWLEIHTIALTETLLIALILLAILAIDRYLLLPSRSRFVLMTVIVACAWLQRSAGMSVTWMAGIAVLCWSPQTLVRRTMAATVLVVLASAPSILWARINPGFQGPAFHPVSGAWWLRGLSLMLDWIVPSTIRLPQTARLAAAITVAILAALIVLAARSRDALAPRTFTPRLVLLFAACYAAVFVLAASFWDRGVEPADRHLVALQMAALLVVGTAASRVDWQRHRVLRASALVAGLAVALMAAVSTGRWLVVTHHEGQYYTSRTWQQSETMLAIRDLPPDAFLVSAANDAIGAVTGRRAARLPDRENPATAAPNPRYAETLARLHASLMSRRGFVVFVDRINDRRYIPGEAEMLTRWKLVLVRRASDGAIYRLADNE